MSGRLKSFLSDDRGVALVEMALIAPILATMALMSYEVWRAAGRTADMRTALKAGAQYYMSGGGDDVAARALALSAWRAKPADGVVAVSRACACGTVSNACTSLCSNAQPPAALVTLRASATEPAAVFNKSLAIEQVVRVR